MYKYKSWSDENKKFGSSKNEVGNSWNEANSFAKSELQKQEEERKKREEQRKLEESKKPIEVKEPSAWEKTKEIAGDVGSAVKKGAVEVIDEMINGSNPSGKPWNEMTFAEKSEATRKEFMDKVTPDFLAKGAQKVGGVSAGVVEGVADVSKADVPYAGTILEAVDLYKIKTIGDKVDKGEEISSDEAKTLDDYLTKLEDLDAKREDTGYAVGEGIRGSVVFMGELLGAALLAPESAGGSIVALVGAKGVKKGAMEMAKKIIADKVVRQAVKKIIVQKSKAIAIETAVVAGVHTPEGSLQRMIGGIEKDEEGNIVKYEGQDLTEATINSFSENSVEVLSERTGGMLGAGLSFMSGKAKSLIIKAGLTNAVSKINSAIPKSQIIKIFNKAGWNGFLPELFEERVGDVLNGALQQAGLGDKEFKLPTKEQMVQEVLQIGIMSTTINTIDRAFGKKGDGKDLVIKKDEEKEPPTEDEKVVIPETIVEENILKTEISKDRDRIIELEKKVETTADENSLNELVAIQDKLDSFQEINKERPVHISDGIQESPIAEIETVKYPDGKFAFRFSADVDTASVTGNFSNTELFNSKEEAVKAGGKAINAWAENELKSAEDEATAIKLDKIISQMQEVIGGKIAKPITEKITPVAKPTTSDESPSAVRDSMESIESSYDDLEGSDRSIAIERENIAREKFNKFTSENSETVIDDKNVTVRVVKFDDGKWANSISVNTNISGMSGPFSGKFATKAEAIQKAIKSIESFIAGNSDNKDIPAIKKAVEELKKEAEKPANNKSEVVEKTQKEKVSEAIKESPKTIKEIAEETKIKEPNIRRILGVGAKEGTFERVEKGVYILNKDGQDIAYVHAGDALETLPRLVKEGLKVNMVFLDIPYDTGGNRGGNRMNEKKKTIFETISVDQFSKFMDSVAEVLEKDESPLIYMFSQSKTSAKEAQAYTDTILEHGFVPLAKGDYYKMTKKGTRFTKPMRKEPLDPEGIIIFNRTGKFDFKGLGETLPELQYKLVRPRGYQTEKPAELLKSLVEMTTNEGEVVLDPFAGSGVTGVEAVKSGRKTVLIEKNQNAVDNFIKPRLQEAIKTNEKDLQKIYSENGEEVSKAMYEIFTELDIAEAGEKLFIDTSANAGPGNVEVIGIKSSFPQWIPEEYRSKKLFDKVMGGLMNIDEITFPDKNKTKQREFYNLLLDEVDDRAGIDTAKIREDIINNYDKIYAKETTTQDSQEAQPKESASGGTQGGQEAGSEEISAENLFGEKIAPQKVESEQKTLAFVPAKDAITAQRGVAQTSKEFQEQEAKKILERQSGQEDFFANIVSKGKPGQISYGIFGHWADIAEEAKTIKEFKNSVITENLTEDFKKFARRRDVELTDSELTEIARQTIINEFTKRTGMTFDEFFKNVKADLSFYDNLEAIDNGKKLDEMLSTSEAKAIAEKINSELNPNLRAFLTLELYKTITTEELSNRGLYQGGWFDPKTNTVGMARDMDAETFAYTYRHEISHAAFTNLPMKERQLIVDWYKTIDREALIELYGDEKTLNDYLKKSEKRKNADEFMADETVQRQLDQKNIKDAEFKKLKPLRDMIERIVLALNKISKKILPSMSKRLKVQRLFKDVFSKTGGEKFAKSQGYLDELKLKGFRTGTIRDMETGFSTQKIKDFSASVNAEEKTDEKVAKEFSDQYGYKPTFFAKGQFADFEEKFGEGMGGLEHIKPLELPELVKMVREVTGQFPEVKSRFRGNRLGDAQAGTMRVRILASLFAEDKIREAKAVLAHELGHIVDFMPDKINRGGNILGRIATISKYLKHTIPGDTTLNSKSIRNELIALSEYWHPYNKEQASPNFRRYRESSVEIYADAMSVLFNSPGLLQEKAPIFYNAFFKFLDRKPAVKQSFFELQSLLEGNREEVIKARQSDLREGFAKAEEIIKQKHEEKKAGNKNFWARLRQQLDDQNYEIIKKQRAYEANGEVLAEGKNPKFLLDELPFVDNENYLLLDDMNEEVVQPIELAGMTMQDMGEYLVLNRIMNDRSDIANPYGFTPDSAKEQLAFMKKSVGEENFKMLEEKMTIFHEKVFASVEEAVRVGSYNKELFDTTIEPNKNTYAAFRVVDYIEENMPAGIKKQVGTFKEIGNPFTATIIKTLSLNRLNAYQRAKTATVEMLAKNGDAVKSKSITTDGKLRIFKPGKGKGTIEMLEDGKFTSYDVDPYIAERFDRDTLGEVNRLVAAVDMFNNKLFKPLVTTYNMGFALAFNPIRDFKRNYKSVKNATVLNLLTSYVKSVPQAFRYARKGELDEFTRSLVENKAIMAPINDYNFDAREDEFGTMLERYGLIKVNEKTSRLPKIVRKVFVGSVVKILESMRLASNTFEIVSKIAGAKVRIKGGESGKALYQNVRDFTGTPNWTRKGQHTRTTNAIFVFSNIMKEGMKSDYQVATNPETRAGFWWKTVKIDLLPKVLQFAAGAGIIDALFGLSGGDDDEDKDGPIKKFFDKVSEYDKSNYLIIPLGMTESGKAIYMRIPHDETGRMISAALWKMMNFAKDRELEQMQDIFSIGAGQLPSVSPIIGISSNWVQFLSGRNPYDAFRGRPLIDDRTFQAGGWPALKKMLQWTTNSMGVTSFATYDSSKDTSIETTLRLTPLFNRLIKVSDYGLQEQEYKKMDKVNKEKARENLIKKDTIKTMVKEGAETEDIVNKVSEELKLDPETIADYKKINLIRTEVKKEGIRQRTSSKTDMLLKAGSNDNKVNMLKKFRLEMEDKEFWTYVDDLYENKVISANVYEQI